MKFRHFTDRSLTSEYAFSNNYRSRHDYLSQVTITTIFSDDRRTLSTMDMISENDIFTSHYIGTGLKKKKA